MIVSKYAQTDVYIHKFAKLNAHFYHRKRKEGGGGRVRYMRVEQPLYDLHVPLHSGPRFMGNFELTNPLKNKRPMGHIAYLKELPTNKHICIFSTHGY